MQALLTSCLIALLTLLLPLAALAEKLPRPDHVVVIVEENLSISQVMDQQNSSSYIHELIRQGMLFTHSYGVTHPSQPNYLALFSGSTQGVYSDACPQSFGSENLASMLLHAGLSFAIFSESLPAAGDTSCFAGAYRRKHNPMVNWQGTNLPAALNKRFAEFPKDFASLPTVSFVIPNMNNDMHNGSFESADGWLRLHIGPYVDWAMQHNSLLILTWDEDYEDNNHVATLLVGPMVNIGTSPQQIDHLNVLRTLLDFYGLPAVGSSRDRKVLEGIWK